MLKDDGAYKICIEDFIVSNSREYSTYLNNGCIVLYDITSTYFEGEYEDSDLVKTVYWPKKKQR